MTAPTRRQPGTAATAAILPTRNPNGLQELHQTAIGERHHGNPALRGTDLQDHHHTWVQGLAAGQAPWAAGGLAAVAADPKPGRVVQAADPSRVYPARRV